MHHLEEEMSGEDRETGGGSKSKQINMENGSVRIRLQESTDQPENKFYDSQEKQAGNS